MFVYKFVPLRLKLEFANILIYKFIPLHGCQMLMGIFYIPLISHFPTFSITNFETSTSIFEKLKVYVQSYNMHLLCYSFKKLELAKRNNFIFQSNRKTKMISKFESMKVVSKSSMCPHLIILSNSKIK
jgi:hypothetical protein